MLLVVPFFFVGQSTHAVVAREPAVIQKEFDAAVGLMGSSPEAAAASFGPCIKKRLRPVFSLSGLEACT